MIAAAGVKTGCTNWAVVVASQVLVNGEFSIAGTTEYSLDFKLVLLP
jgi:hypothetical protein